MGRLIPGGSHVSPVHGAVPDAGAAAGGGLFRRLFRRGALHGRDRRRPRDYLHLCHLLRHGGMGLSEQRPVNGDDARSAGGPDVPVRHQRALGAGHGTDPLRRHRRADVPRCAGLGILRSGGCRQHGGHGADDYAAVLRHGDAVRHADGPHLRTAGVLSAGKLPGLFPGDDDHRPGLRIPAGRQVKQGDGVSGLPLPGGADLQQLPPPY